MLRADGASASVHYLLQAMIQDSSDAFLVPVPQYPLYSAALSLYGGTLMPYYLDEASGWGVDVDSVEQLIRDSMAKGLRVRGLVVINPGNPTGQVLSQENQVGTFCGLCLPSTSQHTFHAVFDSIEVAACRGRWYRCVGKWGSQSLQMKCIKTTYGRAKKRSLPSGRLYWTSSSTYHL